MEPLRLILTDTAREDLRSLHEYIAEEKGSPLSAERFTKDLTEKLYQLRSGRVNDSV